MQPARSESSHSWDPTLSYRVATGCADCAMLGFASTLLDFWTHGLDNIPQHPLSAKVQQVLGHRPRLPQEWGGVCLFQLRFARESETLPNNPTPKPPKMQTLKPRTLSLDTRIRRFNLTQPPEHDQECQLVC